jgi:hypothetical protein
MPSHHAADNLASHVALPFEPLPAADDNAQPPLDPRPARGWIVISNVRFLKRLALAWLRFLRARRLAELCVDPSQYDPRPFLPDDCAGIIASYCDAPALAKMRLVSHGWRACADRRPNWAALLKRDFGLDEAALSTRPADVRELYAALSTARAAQLRAPDARVAAALRLRATPLPRAAAAFLPLLRAR